VCGCCWARKLANELGNWGKVDEMGAKPEQITREYLSIKENFGQSKPNASF